MARTFRAAGLSDPREPFAHLGPENRVTLCLEPRPLGDAEERAAVLGAELPVLVKALRPYNLAVLVAGGRFLEAMDPVSTVAPSSINVRHG